MFALFAENSLDKQSPSFEEVEPDEIEMCVPSSIDRAGAVDIFLAEQDNIKRLCSSMKRQILARAFYGCWFTSNVMFKCICSAFVCLQGWLTWDIWKQSGLICLAWCPCLAKSARNRRQQTLTSVQLLETLLTKHPNINRDSLAPIGTKSNLKARWILFNQYIHNYIVYMGRLVLFSRC